MILVIDNYDSFTYNLVQYLGELGHEVVVIRNDERSVDEVEAMNPDGILISPGPGTPDDAGISIALIQRLKGRIPILGVCLGHQAICQAFGVRVGHAKSVMHGKLSQVHHDGKGVFTDIENPVTVTRYHSLAADQSTFNDALVISATTSDDEIMGVRHKDYAIEGVQFHPESIATEHGHQMLQNFFGGTIPQYVLEKTA